MKDYRLSERADEQLDEIAEYISEWNSDAATRVIAALESTFANLARNPKVGLQCDHLQAFPAKRPADRYIILFYDTIDFVEISHIVHGSRDWPELFIKGEL